MASTQTIESLQSIGGSEWKTPDGRKHRVYFEIADLLEIKIDTYKTGNIASATQYGDPISNSRASKLLTGKIWVDMADGLIWSQLDFNPAKNEIIEALRSRLATIA
jgi:hypothetical protein